MGSFQQGLRQEFASKDDIRRVHSELGATLESLTRSIDRYVKVTESWHQEQLALRAKVDRLSRALLVRGVLRERDLE